LKSKSEQFAEWFDGEFLASRDIASPLLVGENPEVKARFARIKHICMYMIQNPNENEEKLRWNIALSFFVTWRCALDYLNYAKLVLDKWRSKT
jgi:hypothetical protein